MTNRNAMIALLVLTCAAPGWSQPMTQPNRIAVTLTHLDRHPATPDAARRTLARIDRAVLEVCGASGFSLREVKRAIRDSPCWRESMDDAVAQIGDPALRDAYVDRP